MHVRVTTVGYGDACDKDGSQGEGQGMTSSILEQGEEVQEQEKMERKMEMKRKEREKEKEWVR